MSIDLVPISKAMIGQTVPRPTSGALSGHVVGELFDQLVYKLIKKQLPKTTYRQYEYLNELYAKHPTKLTHEERATLIQSKTLQHLLNRGVAPITGWSADKLFEVKQDDTADIIVTEDDYYQLIDVKTVNSGKLAQAPNIISAVKVATMCQLMLANKEFAVHDLFYFEVQWELAGDKLRCVSSCSRNLFKCDPSKLYINWAAAQQLQFHVRLLDQDYAGSKEDWCKAYLANFVRQAKNRVTKMQALVAQFEPLLEQL